MSKLRKSEGYRLQKIMNWPTSIEGPNLKFENLKLVKGTSEKVFSHYQDIAKESL